LNPSKLKSILDTLVCPHTLKAGEVPGKLQPLPISIEGAWKDISVVSWDVMWASFDGEQVLLAIDHTGLPAHLSQGPGAVSVSGVDAVNS
jgi:hypothetical protein